ncbi:tumor protein p63-regulated gene 1-like protein isoform X1 [Leptopilina heterotoma]|uniref:tumor protein p63-regulated gene 1-like protein isoform X1 n=1 Tax=Leptopilina heterotoma TaxID=63436 RepID=UPI001CA8147E|nr:tumor protein p63-regulated gene 1-like protein isoform X1 [Leptopilina heterotoma]XP_043481042.1 tumor protein p63-regulated gene 1-like protein isoform X1 [Leptopilina heterotoma]XP_043481043.1 tumor protein p63-regulated gene 1-like protein isoform X1 [Leptopilina heterotoma]
MMDDTFLDDGIGVHFDKATLEMKKENENSGTTSTTGTTNTKQSTETTSGLTNSSESKHVSNIPFRIIDVHNYFSDREQVIERALKDCQKELVNSEETLLGSWLLTEISLWDTEKERLILLTKDFLFSVKYDLISLKILEFNKVPVMEIDTLLYGDLIYPSKSLLPRLNGLAEGFSSLINCAIRQEWSSSLSGLTHFESRNRNMIGMRIMWNKGQPLHLNKKWNPFAKNIPWLTYTSHPLYWHKGSETDKTKYDVKGLEEALQSIIPEHSSKLNRPIIIENYIGICSLIHNRNSLGFFKIRGKVSF